MDKKIYSSDQHDRELNSIEQNLDVPLSELGIGKVTLNFLHRMRVYTVGQLAKMGIGPLMRAGVYGGKLTSLLYALESNGYNSQEIFYSKSVTDEKQMALLNMPVTKYFDNKKVLKTFFRHNLYRVKDLIFVPDFHMAQIFYDSGDPDAYASTESVKHILALKAGIKLDDKKQIVFKKSALDNLEPLTKRDLIIDESDIFPQRIKTLLFQNNCITFGDLECINLDTLDGMGPKTKDQLLEIMSKIHLKKEEFQEK